MPIYSLARRNLSSHGITVPLLIGQYSELFCDVRFLGAWSQVGARHSWASTSLRTLRVVLKAQSRGNKGIEKSCRWSKYVIYSKGQEGRQNPGMATVWQLKTPDPAKGWEGGLGSRSRRISKPMELGPFLQRTRLRGEEVIHTGTFLKPNFFIQQMCIEYLLCTSHPSKYWQCVNKHYSWNLGLNWSLNSRRREKQWKVLKYVADHVMGWYMEGRKIRQQKRHGNGGAVGGSLLF